jgi:hypothetical protein
MPDASGGVLNCVTARYAFGLFSWFTGIIGNLIGPHTQLLNSFSSLCAERAGKREADCVTGSNGGNQGVLDEKSRLDCEAEGGKSGDGDVETRDNNLTEMKSRRAGAPNCSALPV